jgi:hypothetical protein
MITCIVKHHIPGRIRIEAPVIKGLSIEILKKLAHIQIPDGIKNVKPNPLTGSIVIEYEPLKINIMEYLQSIISDAEIQGIING